jgi:ketosteroid isomerase-like protein
LVEQAWKDEKGETTVITEDEVKTLRRNYMEAQDAGSVEGCLSFWDNEGALMPPDAQVAQGKEVLRSLYQDLFGQVDHRITVSFDEIGVSEEWSFAQGSYEGMNIPKDGSESIPTRGQYLEIHRRQPDGSLKFYRHMFSEDA